MDDFGDAQLDGLATDFETNDPQYASLDGKSIDVFSAPREFPSQFIVNNSRQFSEPKGTWVFTT